VHLEGYRDRKHALGAKKGSGVVGSNSKRGGSMHTGLPAGRKMRQRSLTATGFQEGGQSGYRAREERVLTVQKGQNQLAKRLMASSAVKRAVKTRSITANTDSAEEPGCGCTSACERGGGGEKRGRGRG
jgi:hypothetical protein